MDDYKEVLEYHREKMDLLLSSGEYAKAYLHAWNIAYHVRLLALTQEREDFTNS